VASFCESVEQLEEVCRGIGSDSRIGPEFLRAGSLWRIVFSQGRSRVSRGNARIRVRISIAGRDQKISMRSSRHGLSGKSAGIANDQGKRLAVLGLAFKDGTDDVRESPAIKVIEQLWRKVPDNRF